MDILKVPPAPLAQIDIYFQIGHVYEQLNDVSPPSPCAELQLTDDAQYDRAKEAYERVVIDAPNHAKVLQQLGWLYNLSQASFQNNELAVQYLTKSLESGTSFLLLFIRFLSSAGVATLSPPLSILVTLHSGLDLHPPPRTRTRLTIFEPVTSRFPAIDTRRSGTDPR